MKFKMPRPVITPEINLIARRAIRVQKIYVPAATRKNLKEIAQISGEIKKKGLPSYLIVRKLKGKLGHGVFLHPEAKPIERGQVIASYAGEMQLFPQNQSDDSDYAFAPIVDIRLTKEEQLRFDPKRKYHPRRLYALDLDAVRKGNFTRFINHSEKPNIEACLLRIPPNSHGLKPASAEIVYIAKKRIHPGEQLLVCYEGEDKSYWGVMGIKPFPITPKTFQLSSSLKVQGA
ncbi:MAG: hypothetical protein A3E80_00255 [Chlamydiae bacterium RIFCSPHIGHO2_12_FULL_49_9]|nr:MAG: hypothetical protein A3E80_00255 [Chlamydiae bacterium RIFCSPHIGHO2_12_FULL_49_9]